MTGTTEDSGSKTASRERVLREIATIAFSCYSDFVQVVEGEKDGMPCPLLQPIPTGSIPARKRRALCSMKQCPGGIEVKLYDKWRALQLLWEILGTDEKNAKPHEAQGVQIIDDV